MPIIEVNHVTKEYRLGKFTSAKDSALNTINRLRGRPVQERALFKALDDVHFGVEPGEVVGMIGYNGAGKSTLLKILANIATPTHGSTSVRGKIAPLIEVGAGLVGDLTGRENIYLNGSILGIPKRVIDDKLDEIVAFSELDEFIDTPIKRYSSGMKVKLGFSIATSIDAEILIVDEVLAVGDLAFQRKCFDRMEDLIKRQGRTVLLVSHNIRQVERICHRVILLKHGRIALDGNPTTVCRRYYEDNDHRIFQASKELSRYRQETCGDVEVSSFKLQDVNGHVVTSLAHGQSATISISLTNRKPLIKPIFGIGIHTTDLLYLSTETSELALGDYDLSPGAHTIECTIPTVPLLPGVYSFRVGVDEGEIRRNIFYQENICHFTINAADRGRDAALGFFPLNLNWQILH